MVAEIARRQHGVVSIRQLRSAGLSDDAVLGRVRAGRLHRVYRGVYAVGHRAGSLEAQWIAAVLATGAIGGVRDEERSGTTTILDHWGAAVSYRSAAVLWGLLPGTEATVDVSVRGNGGKAKRPGIRVHRHISLAPDVVTLRKGIPVTNPARTIADLRRASLGAESLISPRELRRAIRQAEVLGLPLGDDVTGDRTRSDLERAFLRLCRRYGLPEPEVNIRIGPHLVDFLWRRRRLVVETDGYAYHRGKAAFEDDRARDLDLRARGFDVLRLAENQIEEDARRVAEVVAAGLRVGADAEFP